MSNPYKNDSFWKFCLIFLVWYICLILFLCVLGGCGGGGSYDPDEKSVPPASSQLPQCQNPDKAKGCV